MGRKNRNRIKKELQVEDECSDEYDEDDKKVQNEYSEFSRQHDIIWETRMKMIEYCDKTAIPLCDYLDQDTMIEFIEFLQEK